MRTVFIVLFLILLSGSGFGQTFFEYYETGLKYADSDSLNMAIASFENAIKIRKTDDKQARTYGVTLLNTFLTGSWGMFIINSITWIWQLNILKSL